MFKFRPSVIIITLISFIISSIFFTVSIYSQQSKEVLTKIETPVIGIKDTFRLRIEIRKENLVHVNDDSLFYDFELIGDKRYLKNEKTGFFEIEYKLKPMNRGTFAIQGAVATFKDGAKIRSNTVKITVIDGSIYKKEEVDPIRKLPSDKKVFIKVETDKNTYYKGETIIYTCYLYSVYPIERAYQYKGKKPVFQKDFWGSGYDELVVISAKNKKEILNDVEYSKKLLDKRILYAKKPGEYTFGPYTWVAQAGKGKVYENKYVIKSNRKTISVKSLPDTGKPVAFQGSVGEFNISLTVSGNDGYNENDVPVFTGDSYVKAYVTISGKANPDTVTDPYTARFETDFKIISVNTIPKQKMIDEGYTFSRRYEYLLQPKKTGLIDLPSLELSYFNPKKERYYTNKTKSITIRVMDEALTNQKENKDIIDVQLAEVRAKLNPISEPNAVRNIHAYILTGLNRFFILAYIIFLVLLTPTSVWVYRYRMRLKENSTQIKKENAGKVAVDNLKEIQSRVADNDTLSEYIYDDLYDILLTYLADAYALKKGNISVRKIISESLNDTSINKNKLIDAVGLIERLEFIKFSGNTNFNKININKDIELLSEIIFVLENEG